MVVLLLVESAMCMSTVQYGVRERGTLKFTVYSTRCTNATPHTPTHFAFWRIQFVEPGVAPARHPGRVTNKPLGSQWLSTHLFHLVRLATWHKLVSRHTSTCAATPRRCKRSEGMRSPRLRLSALSAGVRSRPYSRVRILHMMAAVNRMPRTHTRASQRVDGCARLAVLSRELWVSLDG